MGECFLVGDWLVQPQRDCIEQGEEAVHLKPKAMAVLVRLARANGEVVTRQELFESVWPGSTVSDATLTQCIVELRHAFGDDARQPEFIETIPRVGFRLIPVVTPIATDERPAAPSKAGRLVDAMRRQPGNSALRKPLRWSVPALLLALVLLAYFVYRPGAEAPAPVFPEKSVAVLAFSDLSEDRSQDWFAEGLAEDLRASLVRLRGLRVAGSVSSGQFSADSGDSRAVAEALRVDYLLTGSVMARPERLRISAKLIDAESGHYLWSEIFDRPKTDLLNVRAEISESVAVALSITLGVGELGTARGGTASFEAFEMSMRAREAYQKFTPDSVTQAIGLLNQAVQIDPGYTEAWARLATYCYLATIAFDEEPPIDFLALSQDALDRARAVDPALPALLPVTLDLHSARKDWPAVERTMRQARKTEVALLPEVHFSYGVFLIHVGRVHEALPRFLHARRLEPLAPWYGSKLGHALMLNGRIGDALEEHEKVWRGARGNRSFQSTDGLMTALAAGDTESISTWLERTIDHVSASRAAGFAALKGLLDDPESALAWLRLAFEEQAFPDFWIAVFAAHLGDAELALQALQRHPDGYALWMPSMTVVRAQPGFEEVVEKLGLPPYWREFGWADVCQPVGEEGFICK